MVLPALTWSITRTFTQLNTMMDDKKRFYKYFDHFPDIMVSYTMFCDHDQKEKIEILVEPLLSFSNIAFDRMKFLVMLL